MGRPHIEAAFNAAPAIRLLLVSAPAGFGKTSVLAALAQSWAEAGKAVAWLSLNAAQHQPPLFLRQLIKALAPVLPDFAEEALAYLHNSAEVPVAALMEGLLAELGQLREPVLLVLDDLHLIDSPELLAGLDRLVRFCPAGLLLALGSRSLPALKVATWRAKGWLLEIGERELRLSQDETRRYLASHGQQLSDADFAELYRHTEGWMAGVHLASLWLRGHPQGAGHLADMALNRALPGDYLMGTVFEQLAAPTQQLLLSICVAQQISGSLVAALSGCADGQQQLEELEAMQLFLLPLDRERHWYRFHNLFADFLRSRLQACEPERFRQLHFKASLWFANHHMPHLALEHARLAEDPQMLAALIDGCGLELINRGQLHLIYQWRQQVPDEVARKFPLLMLTDVWNRAAELELDQAYRLLDELLQGAPHRADQPLDDKGLAILAVKAVIALQKDDLQNAVSLAHGVVAQLGQRAAFLETAILIMGAFANLMLGGLARAERLLALAQQRNHFLEGGYLGMQLANVEVLLCLQRGQLQQAAQLSGKLHQRCARWLHDRARARALPTISDALIGYHQGRLCGLEERLRWALGTVDVIKPIDLYGQGLICLAQLLRLEGKHAEALATLQLIQTLAARHRIGRFLAQAVSEQIALILAQSAGDSVQVAEQRLASLDWSQLAEAYPHMSSNPVPWFHGLSRVRLLQAKGQDAEAMHEISRLRALLADEGQALRHLRLDLLSALSQQRLGYQERSQQLLLQCLIAAERENLCSVFIEEGEPVRGLLQLEIAARQPALQPFVRSLLALWPAHSSPQSGQKPAEPLTEREHAVIELAARGLSNEQIGQSLALALGTVKWHLHNLYQKLEVRNRTQAIRRARELELLES